MAKINLSKEDLGQKVMLDKDTQNYYVGCGWKPNAADGEEFDLDIFLFLATNGQIVKVENLIYHKNRESIDGAIVLSEDNKKGEEDGSDAEHATIDFSKIDPEIDEIAVFVDIYKGAERGQNFGRVKQPYIRIVNAENDEEEVFAELDWDASVATGATCGSFIRRGDKWAFDSATQTFNDGIAAAIRAYGLDA